VGKDKVVATHTPEGKRGTFKGVEHGGGGRKTWGKTGNDDSVTDSKDISVYQMRKLQKA